MYYCPDCGSEFEKPKKISKTNLNILTDVYLACPECSSRVFHIKNSTHCRCCGAKLTDGAVDYCSAECRNKIYKLHKEHLRIKLIGTNKSLAGFVRQNEINNIRYGTNYSYGQFTNLLYYMENKNATRR